MPDREYPEHVFARAYNNAFGPQASWHKKPDLDDLTHMAEQRMILDWWGYYQEYRNAVSRADRQYKAAQTLEDDTLIETYKSRYDRALSAYHVFLDNVEKSSEMNFPEGIRTFSREGSGDA